MVYILFSRWDQEKLLLPTFEKLILLGASFSFLFSGLMNGLIPYLKGFERIDQDKKLPPIFLSSLFVSIVTGILVIIGSTVFFDGVPLQTVLVYSIYLSLFNLNILSEFLMIIKGYTIRLVIYISLISFSYLLIIGMGIYYQYSLEKIFSILIVLELGKLVYTSFQSTILKKGESFASLKPWYLLSFPIIISMFLGNTAPLIDGYLVSHFFGDNAFVIFRYGAREIPFVLLLANALSAVGSGVISENNRNGKPKIGFVSLKNSTRKLSSLLFPISIILLLFSEPLFNFLFTESFIESVAVFDVYVLLVIPRMLFPQAVYKGLSKTSMLPKAGIIDLIVNVVLSLLFMKIWGIWGIALASVIAFLTEKIILVYFLKKRDRLPLSLYHPIATWAIWSSVLLMIFILKILFLG